MDDQRLIITMQNSPCLIVSPGMLIGIISGVIEAEEEEFIFSVDLKDDPDNLPLKGLEEGQLVKFTRVDPPEGMGSEQAEQSEKVERDWAEQIEILVA